MRWLLLLVALAGCNQRQARADCIGEVDCRPPFGAPALDGSPLGEDAVAGKVVLVNFWATWCPPCAHELPALQAVYARHKDDGLVIVGVVTGDRASDDTVRAFAAARQVGYPLVRGTSDLERRFGLGDALPTSYLYDKRGHLVRRWQGDTRESDLERLVTQALSQ